MEKSSRAPVETVSAGLYLESLGLVFDTHGDTLASTHAVETVSAGLHLESLGLVFGYWGETKHWTVAAIQNLVVNPLIRVIRAFLND
jgi:hypothetical protein